MTTVMDMLKRVEALNVESLTIDAMDSGKWKLVKLNQDQLLKGYDSKGNTLGTYRPWTVAARQEKGRQTNHVDLFYEGDFQEKMYLKLDGDSFDFWSTDWKADKLADKYGDDIFGLTSESKRIAWTDIIAPNVLQVIRRNTGMQ